MVSFILLWFLLHSVLSVANPERGRDCSCLAFWPLMQVGRIPPLV